MRKPTGLLLLGLALIPAVPSARGADLVALTPQSWDGYAPPGKEADAIEGDLALRNDKVLAVVARPIRGRHANMTVRDVGGALIDLVRRDSPSDQLSAYYPAPQTRALKFAGVEAEEPELHEADPLDRLFVRARRVTLRLAAEPREREPDMEVSYALEDGWPGVRVTTTLTNRRGSPATVQLVDSLRLDGPTFEASAEGPSDFFFAYDKHFGQAYGIFPDAGRVSVAAARQRLVRYASADGTVAVTLEPGRSHSLVRWVVPGRDLFEVRRGAPGTAPGGRPSVVTVRDEAGRPVAGADVALSLGGVRHSWGRTDAKGTVAVGPAGGPVTLQVGSPGRGERTALEGAELPPAVEVALPSAGVVVAEVRDEGGGPIPCKVQFIGRDGTPSPDFGPDGGEFSVRNVEYSPNGSFRREIGPGKYDVIVSRGPEHDAAFTTIEVARGAETPLRARLVRSVMSDGWISSDFHSHSSPSGDNASSQLGRVLNLLCEHVEFAPCTEHNRLSTYEPHLKALGAERLMATCVGIELTGSPLPINHQNAFPLELRPRTQDGGGPTRDDDPATQIQRLAFWDNRSEKLVQVNHPDLGWMFYDRNGDGKPDGGFSGMFGQVDVIEVHPPHTIFGGPTVTFGSQAQNNTIYNWLQLLNQGRRIPGVVNTDAHANFHGSGWLRNYIKSPTDDPALVRVLDVVRASERGNLVMSNGPFLEVTATAGQSGGAPAGPGDDLQAPGGKVALKVRVQCPNWFDVDRVQVFVNGRADDRLNFTRQRAADRFSSTARKFDQELAVELPADAHLIVAAIGEGSRLGPVMGPEHGNDLPVAVSNPIYVDVDGGGFKANGDALGGLPVKQP